MRVLKHGMHKVIRMFSFKGKLKFLIKPKQHENWNHKVSGSSTKISFSWNLFLLLVSDRVKNLHSNFQWTPQKKSFEFSFPLKTVFPAELSLSLPGGCTGHTQIPALAEHLCARQGGPGGSSGGSIFPNPHSWTAQLRMIPEKMKSKNYSGREQLEAPQRFV